MVVTIVVAVLVLAGGALCARWVRDRCSELEMNLFGPTSSPPSSSPT
jgi:hypothetical protein